jgi:hypothetical protein
MMASDDKKIKTAPAPKSEALPKEKSEALPKDKSPASADPSTADGGEKSATAPAGYSRGEGQKPVSKAYKENWNAIFAKKKKR